MHSIDGSGDETRIIPLVKCEVSMSSNWLLYTATPYTDRRIKFNLDNLRTPTNHSEIVEVVEEALRDHRKVRVLAAGHSWSEIAQTPDIMVTLHDYSGIIAVDKAALTATVKAGTSLSDLSLLLDTEGLAMINLGSVAPQSLAGAISTGTCIATE